MYVRCEKKGIRIDDTWLPKGECMQVTKEVADRLKQAASMGLVSLHSKNPAAKKVSARKARTAPGMEALEKSVAKNTSKAAE